MNRRVDIVILNHVPLVAVTPTLTKIVRPAAAAVLTPVAVPAVIDESGDRLHH
jgi:hypothetical protein